MKFIATLYYVHGFNLKAHIIMLNFILFLMFFGIRGAPRASIFVQVIYRNLYENTGPEVRITTAAGVG